MEKSIFFNSAPGDPRTYQASDFAGYFGTVLSSGLFHTDNIPALEVHCDGSDLRTYVNAGKAAIQGYFYENTSDLYLQHALPEASLDRIDRIVLRLDKRNQSRFIRLFVIQGLSSATPVAPALQRDEYIFELCLAEIRVRANTSTLVPADLVDKRLVESLCGLVYSLISIPTSQFQQEWDTFMASVQDGMFVTHEEFAETTLYLYKKDVTVVDANGNPTVVEYRRADNTLVNKRTASNPDANGFYRTVVEQFYDATGTLGKTSTYTYTFLANGIIDTSDHVEVIA